METTFSICAAPKLGSIAGTKKVGRVKRPINLTIVAEDADSIMSKGNVITFECKKFDVIKKLSSRKWKNLFDFQHEGKKVTVIVPDNYVCLPVSFMLYLFWQFLSVFSLGIGRILIPFFYFWFIYIYMICKY